MIRVFHAVGSLDPGYGGPARSVPALAAALEHQGCTATVWAPDGTGAGDGEPEGYQLVHDHGIWLPHNWRLARQARRLRLPRIVSPRGMLEPWALRHKRWKKRVAWWLYQRRDLAAADCLHATSELEVTSIRKLFPQRPVCLIPNGVDVPEFLPERTPSPDGVRTALFLGRLYPVKGLPMLVKAWKAARPSGWRLKIAGPDEAGHRSELERLIQKEGLEAEISFSGPLDETGKSSAFADAELFILPSYSENFGMAAAEAMGYGLPVITTTGTPWSMLPRKNCGWSVAPETGPLADALRSATACPPEVLREMGLSGRAFMQQEYSWCRSGVQMMEVYRWILRQGSQPACVVS